MKIVIKVKNNIGEHYFHKIDRQHVIAVVTNNPTLAKTFKTVAAAEKFLAKHTDCGYGLNKADTQVTTL